MSWKIAVTFPLMALAVALGFIWPWQDDGDVLCLPGVVEIAEVRLASQIGGRVAEVHVSEGERVERDALLVSLEAPRLVAQRAQWEARLAAAQAELEQTKRGARTEQRQAAQAALQAARARLARLQSGARPQELAEAESALQSAEADLAFAQPNYERAESLRQDASISQMEYESRRRAYEQARARRAAAQARLELLRAGSHPQEIAQAEAEVRRAAALLRLVEAGPRPEEVTAARSRVAELQARLRELDVQLREAQIRAPTAAAVEVVAVRAGDVVAPHQGVVRILHEEDLWVRVYVPETELGKIRVGQAVRVSVDSFSQDFAGQIQQIAAQSEFTPRNVQSVNERRHQVFGVKIRVDNTPGVLKSGMAAQVCIPTNDPS